MDEFEIPASREQTVVDVVHSTALAAILVGTFRAGDELNDRSWAVQFGVARSQIREAFDRLELQGLIDVPTSKFRSLRTFSDDEVRHTAWDWAVLHGMVVRSLPAKVRGETAVALHYAHEAAQDTRAEDRQVASFEFYELIRDASPSRTLRLAASSATYRCRLAGTSPADRPTGDAALQAGIIDALEVDGPAEVERLLFRWATPRFPRRAPG